ncbi:MAG: hypothetical protein V4638_06455 [Bacteroidota bacterium]
MEDLIDNIEKKKSIFAKDIFQELGFEAGQQVVYRVPWSPKEHTQTTYSKTDHHQNKWQITTKEVFQGNNKRIFLELFGEIAGRNEFKQFTFTSKEKSMFSIFFRRNEKQKFKTSGLDENRIEQLGDEFEPLVEDYFSIETKKNKVHVHYLLENLDFENLRLLLNLTSKLIEID